MLLAASESAVTKKPRLRLMMRRSSSDNPFGSFHRAMSRFMFTSCGIQWLAQVARYFSQAHLYLKGTSWLTSVWPLMMRLSAALTRRVMLAGAAPVAGFVAACVTMGATEAIAGAPSSRVRSAGWGMERGASRFASKPLLTGFDGVGVTSSSQVNIGFPVLELCERGGRNQSVRSHPRRILLLHCIGVLSENADTSFCDARSRERASRVHWQASQVESSTPQNLMSVAGVAPPVAAPIWARAAAAAASIALIAPSPVCAAAAACMPPFPLPLLTAFRRPDCTVDFSACVALVVRR